MSEVYNGRELGESFTLPFYFIGGLFTATQYTSLENALLPIDCLAFANAY